ncbi:hypothetical protein [Crateriforma spongiae]|uniref:hypothetical protein n=1 Tax=Crateriforma spongiae TaxID=2724528 RepID=UPI001445F3A2|nr:hypothetical protein [Crateriforma spongiae]
MDRKHDPAASLSTTPMPFIAAAMTLAVLFGVLRIGQCLQFGDEYHSIDSPGSGTTSLTSVHFDPDADALLWIGSDSAAGQRGYDDDQNSVIDDSSELGAIHSDDRIITKDHPAFSSASDDGISRVMFAGALVSADSDDGTPVIHFRDGYGNDRVWFANPISDSQ